MGGDDSKMLRRFLLEMMQCMTTGELYITNFKDEALHVLSSSCGLYRFIAFCWFSAAVGHPTISSQIILAFDVTNPFEWHTAFGASRVQRLQS